MYCMVSWPRFEWGRDLKLLNSPRCRWPWFEIPTISLCDCCREPVFCEWQSPHRLYNVDLRDNAWGLNPHNQNSERWDKMRKVSVSRRCQGGWRDRIIRNKEGRGWQYKAWGHPDTHVNTPHCPQRLTPSARHLLATTLHPSHREGLGGLWVSAGPRRFLSIGAIQAGLSLPIAPMGTPAMGRNTGVSTPSLQSCLCVWMPYNALRQVTVALTVFDVPVVFSFSAPALSNFIFNFKFNFLSIFARRC